MKLALDNHFSPKIATQLREHGYDVVAAVEAGWEAKTDEELLLLCRDARRALLTNDVSDFIPIVRSWAAASVSHFGLVFSSQVKFPTSRGNVGAYVRALERLMLEARSDDALVDQIRWL